MKRNPRLKFELSVPASARFMPVLSSGLAGILRDIGIDEEEGKKMAGLLVDVLTDHLPSDAGKKPYNVVIALSQNGSDSALRIACRPKKDLSRLARGLEVLPSWMPFMDRAGSGPTADITFNIPGKKVP